MWEKNGSRDAFRFFIHEATGGSDHIVFNNRSVGVPGIEFFTWPDQWYHADKDLPENADPTEMKRVAFIGATSAWVSANLTDEVLPGLLDEVTAFGYARVAERSLPRAMRVLESVGAGGGNSGQGLGAALARATNILAAGVAREHEALQSVREIATGSSGAIDLIADREMQWALYGDHLEEVVLEYARGRAVALGAPIPVMPERTDAEREYDALVPVLSSEVRGRQFNVMRSPAFQEWTEENPGVLEELGLGGRTLTPILNFVDGRRSVLTIRDRVAAWTAEEVTLQQVAGYLRILEEVGWIRLTEGGQ
jgi:hypothetical protein